MASVSERQPARAGAPTGAAATSASQDGAVDPELSQDGAVDPMLYNEDLRPTRAAERNWTWLNYSTVWMGMVHNIVAYTTAASLIALGMSVWQALLTVITANVILILAMCANSVAGGEVRASISRVDAGHLRL